MITDNVEHYIPQIWFSKWWVCWSNRRDKTPSRLNGVVCDDILTADRVLPQILAKVNFTREQLHNAISTSK